MTESQKPMKKETNMPRKDLPHFKTRLWAVGVPSSDGMLQAGGGGATNTSSSPIDAIFDVFVDGASSSSDVTAVGGAADVSVDSTTVTSVSASATTASDSVALTMASASTTVGAASTGASASASLTSNEALSGAASNDNEC